MKTDAPEDYFVHMGYRKMMIHLLKATADDLLLNPKVDGNKEKIAEARAWVSFDPVVSRVVQPGLSFSECVVALGAASEIDDYRIGFLRSPEITLRECNRALDAMNAAEGVFTDAKSARRPETLTTAGFNNGWLFGQSPAAAGG